MTDRKGRLNKNSKKRSDGVFVIVIVALLVLGFLVTAGVFSIAIKYPVQATEKGAWGDFIGGTLNPILTFFTFLGVLVSIFLQRKELSLSNRELERSADALEHQIISIERQNFESAFFQMLNTFNGIVNSIDLFSKVSGQETKGRDCFSVFYTRLTKEYRDNQSKGGGKYSPEEIIKLSYFNFWKNYQLELGHYYRFLFNVFKFLDESELGKSYHAKLLRAQLSDQELLLLFYNCLSEHGKEFSKYAIKYELFDNLPTVRLLDEAHISLADKRSFGDNPMYNSKTFRSSF